MNADALNNATFQYLGEQMMKLGMNEKTINILLNAFDSNTQNIIFNKLEESGHATTETVINIIKHLEMSDKDRMEVISALNENTISNGDIDKLIKPGFDIKDYEEQLKKQAKKSWNSDEDSFLEICVACFNNQFIDWTKVSYAMISNKHYRRKAACEKRWFRVLNPMLQKDSWTNEENEQLFSLVKQYGEKNWLKISSMIGNRSDVQCRYRYRQIIRHQMQILPRLSSSQNVE